ncbi:hypothetical protein E6H32_08600 [Candidatus Bathyarchaeota archaeon]|nr:MAG: hypothetical protein E6H32_08600 [Candidatus Bathyarchaeota archaeon]
MSAKHPGAQELVFLGTGGADCTPRVGCLCEICAEARQKKGRYARNGPSVFFTGADLLFDTPEDVAHSLEREEIHYVSNLVYSHWHPDHTMGRRVLEQLNLNLRKRTKTTTNVWLPSWVRDDFRKKLGLEDHFQFFEKMEIVKIHELAEGEAVKLGDATVKAFRMTQPGLASYLVQHGGKRVVLALDEIKDWNPGGELLAPDVLVLETGWFEHDKQGEQIIPTGHWIRRSEASFEETLDLIQKINPRLAIATHIEELNGRSYADYLELEKKYKKYRLRFAYDGLRVSI